MSVQASKSFPTLPWATRSLLVLLLVVPGSPDLLLDGLPFAKKMEVVALLVLMALLVSKTKREFVSPTTYGSDKQRFSQIILVSLIILKFLSFSLDPIGNHFEVCIKSTYSPTSGPCEKSFDYIFGNGDRVNRLGDITRIDPKIAFKTTTNDPRSLLGASHSTWNLPFQNEYPRFSALWLDRLPFTARIGASVQAPADGILPVELVGSIRMKVDGKEFSYSSTDSRELVFIPMNGRRQELVLDYEFKDSTSRVIPDGPPPPLGPYAHLVLGQPILRSSSTNITFVVRGFAVNLNDDRKILAIQGQVGNEVITTEEEYRPDVAEYFNNASLAKSGFILRVPMRTTLLGVPPISIFASLDDGTSIKLGTVTLPLYNGGIIRPLSEPDPTNVLKSDIVSRLEFSGDLEPMSPIRSYGNSTLLKFLCTFVDIGQLAMLTFLLWYAWKAVFKWSTLQLRSSVIIAVGSVLIPVLGHVVVRLTDAHESWTFLIVLTSVGLPLSWFVWRKQRPTVFVAATSVVIGSFQTLETARRFAGLSAAPWWGHMIFRDRTTDWFVFQGYAYQILKEQSLRAGEAVFYFMPGARYLIFTSHLLFGNNDVLIAMLLYSTLIASGLYFVYLACKHVSTDKSQSLVLILLLVPVLLLLQNPLSVQLSIGNASEIFAWVLYLSALAILISDKVGCNTTWLGVILGTIVVLRPNYLMISVCLIWGLFIGELRVKRTWSVASSNASMLFAFIVVVSLPMLHNAYYGEQLIFFTRRADPNQTVFEPIRLLWVFSDSLVQTELVHKLQMFLFWQPVNFDGFQVASWISQLIYVLAVIQLVRDRTDTARRIIYLLSPLAYLASAVPFGVMTIPERQTTMMTLSLLGSAVLSNAGGQARNQHHKPVNRLLRTRLLGNKTP